LEAKKACGRRLSVTPILEALDDGAWTVEVAWKERGKPASVTSGHRHRSREVAGSWARVWRRRVRREVEEPAE
jgi:hypothetical protein